MDANLLLSTRRPRTAQTAGARHRRYQLPCGTNLYTLDEALRVLADPVRDRRYLETALGPQIDRYLSWRKAGRPSSRTLDTYERILARLAVSVPAGVDVAALELEHLLLLHDTIPPDSWKLHRSVWNGFVEWAIENDLRAAKNPVKRLPKLLRQQQRRVRQLFTESERDLLVHAARLMDDPVRDKARAILILDSGFRKGELRRLRLWDVDPADRTVKVTGKGDKEREIPIYGDFWLAWEAALLEPIPKTGIGWRPDDYVFFPMRVAGAYQGRARQVTASYPDRPMSERGFHEWWGRLVAHAGIPYRNLHTTRHTYATAALDASAGDLYGVAELLGHASTKTTEAYLHSSKRRKESVAEALARVRRSGR